MATQSEVWQSAELDHPIAIAAVLSDGSAPINAVLAELARRLAGEGRHIAGVLQLMPEGAPPTNCDMTLFVLPDGPRIGISQALGQHATGCRLDHEALEEAAGLVDRSLEGGADVLIVNKFGKREGEGAGFRQTIARAVALGIPVLVGIAEAELPSFESFVGDGADVLPASLDHILAWYRARQA